MTSPMKMAQGSTRLLFDSIEGIVNTVEQMHKTIAPSLPSSTPPINAHGLIASSVYRTIRGINRTIRNSADTAFTLANIEDDNAKLSVAQHKIAASLNGAIGDHLEATGNSLAIPMQLTTPDKTLLLKAEALSESLPKATPHIVVLVHGLCMSEKDWERKNKPSIGSKLQSELGYTPLYLNYNSGRHISTNGKELAQLLDQLYRLWPVPLESISLIGHSMGGLVIRSACDYAQQTHTSWLKHLSKIAYLGTPHHGAPLEKASHALDSLMQKTAYTKPLAIGRQRSAGIKDLRHGNLLDEDWQGINQDESAADTRKVVPLSPNVEHYFVAASIGEEESDSLGHLLGDLLVRLDSAVGCHKINSKSLSIKTENCRVFHKTNHLDLLDNDAVQQQVIRWFNIK